MTDSNERTTGTAIDVIELIGASQLTAPARIEALMDVSRQALEHATSDAERLRERGHWQAAHRLANAIGRSDIAVQAAEMVCTAEHYIFLADQKAPPERGGRGKKADRDISKDMLKKIRNAFRYVDTRLFHELAREARETGIPLSRLAIKKKSRQAIRDARPGPVPEGRPIRPYYASLGELMTTWITPPPIIECARRTMGGIDLDPTSTAVANEIVKADRYYTEDDDGLKCAWSGRVWLNPPYNPTEVLSAFIDRLVEHLEEGRVTQAMLLIENKTDTVYFHAAADKALALCLIRRRVRFHNADGTPCPGNPPHGHVLLYFHTDPDPNAAERFAREFRAHGRVWVPQPQGAREAT